MALTPSSHLMQPPLLGTARSTTEAELALAADIDALHQLIYMRGGLSSTNAALEEVSKLLFIKIALDQNPDLFYSKVPSAVKAFAGDLAGEALVAAIKEAFGVALIDTAFELRRPDGELQTLWPVDEPFRISNPDVLLEALRIVSTIASAQHLLTDPLGTAFDAFLSGRYDHSGGLGTYLTPSGVARFMADVALEYLDPFQGWNGKSPLVVDPFCGTGRFLVAAYEAFIDKGISASVQEAALSHGIYAADQSASAIAKTGLNLMLFGARQPHAFQVEDSISSPTLRQLDGAFPLILTNPPFGDGKYDDPQGLERTREIFPAIKRNRIDPALGGIATTLHLLREDGVAGIVLPDGIINGRPFLHALDAGRFNVLSSVSLPTATFSLSGTVARTSAVFIQKDSAKSYAVLARADHVGFLKKNGKAIADPKGSDLPFLLDQIRDRLSSPAEVASVEVLSESPLLACIPDELLSTIDPSRFDADSMNAKDSLLHKGADQLSDLVGSRRKQSAKAQVGVPFVSVLHVDAYGTVDWNEANSYLPTTPGQVARPGDVMISLLNPSKLRAAVVPLDGDAVACSSEFGILSGAKYPYAILAMLYHPQVAVQLRPLGTGTSSSRRRIAIDDVLSLVVPKMTDEELAALNSSVRDSVLTLEAKRSALADSYGFTLSP